MRQPKTHVYTYYTLQVQIHLYSDVLIFSVILCSVHYWYNQKKMDQTLHLFPTVALEVCNSLEIFDYTASDD
jgi:hypothetical protein